MRYFALLLVLAGCGGGTSTSDRYSGNWTHSNGDSGHATMEGRSGELVSNLDGRVYRFTLDSDRLANFTLEDCSSIDPTGPTASGYQITIGCRYQGVFRVALIRD